MRSFAAAWRTTPPRSLAKASSPFQRATKRLANGPVTPGAVTNKSPACGSAASCSAPMFPLMAAAVIMASAPAIIVYVVLQRYFVSGLTAGAVR